MSRRPELIDENALVDQIESGHLSGAALDVFENKRGINPRLLALAEANKVVLTAHMASATLEARIEMGETVIVNIRAFMDGHQPPHRVLPESQHSLGRTARVLMPRTECCAKYPHCADRPVGLPWYGGIDLAKPRPFPPSPAHSARCCGGLSPCRGSSAPGLRRPRLTLFSSAKSVFGGLARRARPGQPGAGADRCRASRR